jgi:hypothetical protein
MDIGSHRVSGALRRASFTPAFAANIFDRWPSLRPFTLRFGRSFHTEVSNPIRFAPANRRRALNNFAIWISPVARMQNDIFAFADAQAG